MAFSFIASAKGETAASGTTLDCSASLNVAAGDLLVAWVVYEGASAGVSIAKDGGIPTNSFAVDAGDAYRSGISTGGCFGYVLSAAADATATFRATWDAARAYRKIFVMQFRPDAGDVVSRDTGAGGTGSGTAATSGNITTTGTDEVVVGGVILYADGGSSAEAINGTAADGVLRSASDASGSIWYRILSATFADGAATVTMGRSEAWACGVIAFKGTSTARKWFFGRIS